MPAKSTTDPNPSDPERDDPYLISPEEAWRIFDAQALKRLGMTGKEFLRKLGSGELVIDDTDHNVMFVEGLIPSHIRYGR